ncbi:hypothetical protein [uncultured Clostridium sp.]|uniref:hypothetical protein n=1 Tax=uncultured Clostridium sp. TaxID=59620 RepID=UPI0026F38B9D|nr:hypothetical protein [uncultured Clostridium sp.]
MVFKEYLTPLELLNDLQKVLSIEGTNLVIKIKTIINMDYKGRDEKAIALEISELYNKFKIKYSKGNMIFNIDTLDSIKILSLNKNGRNFILIVSRNYTKEKLRELQRYKRRVIE